MSSVIVIAEKDRSCDEWLTPQNRVLPAQNSHSVPVTFRPVRRTRAISVFGDYDRLVRKCGMDFVHQALKIGWTALLPAADVLIALHEIHQARYILRLIFE